MSDDRRAGLLARICLTAGALLPYWRILTFSVVLATDDYFTSDIFNAELPGRLLVTAALRAGRLPLWTHAICSGYPLAGAPADPIGLLLFLVLPPAAALDGLLLILLLVAAHGAYSLARRLGADAISAVLGGLAFAGSGYIATQLKHLSILSTVAWMPVGLLIVDRLFTDEPRRRGVLLAILGLLFANQALAGFPQAAYICALVYGSFLFFRLVEHGVRVRATQQWLPLVAGFAAAMLLGATAAAVVLVPLGELAAFSNRVAPLDYLWASYTNFWPRNIWTFFVPYINGDASDRTYIGPLPFSENYGYVGLATALLAIAGAVRERRRPEVAFLVATTLVAFAFSLGARTPVYYAAFQLVPGMNRFRSPSRFLVVVDLGIALLGAVGLSRVRGELAARLPATPRLAPAIAIGLAAATAIDLWAHQARQNVFVPARDWLAPPPTAEIVRADAAAPRTFTPRDRDVHRWTYESSHGWSDVRPYFRLRSLLEPDTGGVYWNVPSADCYVGLPHRWYVLVWSYHHFENSLVSQTVIEDVERRRFAAEPPFTTLMRAYGVTHVVSAFAGSQPGLTLVGQAPDVNVYRVEGAARVRVVRAARSLPSEAHVVTRLRDGRFDPDREILLIGAEPLRPRAEDLGPTAAGPAGTARITHDADAEVVIETESVADAFLLLADTYYPGWTATVDGAETPIYRANVSVRGIALPKGHHIVRFTYSSASLSRGLRISAAALLVLGAWLALAWIRG